MTDDLYKPWEERGRRYRGEEFRFSDTQVDEKTMAFVMNYIRMFSNIMRMMAKYEIRNGLRPYDPDTKDQF